MNDYEFYKTVPKTPAENLKFRLNLRKWANGNPQRQKQIINMCKVDVLHFLNVWAWLYEPRPLIINGKKQPHVIPFITWPHQDRAIEIIDENLGFSDMGMEKSRGEGASWIAVLICLHRWLFTPMFAAGLVSRNELAADNPDDPDSLMWKLDWELTQLPKWMVPKSVRNVSKHVLRNVENGSTIIGYSATGDVASGGRKHCFIMDELAKFPVGSDQEAMDSTQHVTESRLVISTPKGCDGAYYNLMHADSSIKKIILDWTENPTRNSGMFTIAKGWPLLVDPNLYGKLPEGFAQKFHDELLVKLQDRGFDCESTTKRWSPWYVRQCLRAGATPQSIAQELDRDYGGSMSRFFSTVVIDRLMDATVRPPKLMGDIIFSLDRSKINFVESPGGRLRLWCELVGGKHPPRSCEYVLGCDVASGIGGLMTSNSTLTVAERETGKKVAEFASPSIPPEEFADYAVAMCNWFTGKSGSPGFLIWEDNGYGAMFRNRVFETTFRNFFYRTSTDKLKRKAQAPGWYTSRRSKRELLGRYAYSLGANDFTNPSKEALVECREYMNLSGGRIEHVAAESADDPSGAGENHGDRVIADALVNWVIQDSRDRAAEAAGRKTRSDGSAPETSILRIREDMNRRERKKELW